MVCDIVTENLIKGIIVAHSRTGITVNRIANVFRECAGYELPYFNGGEMELAQYLDRIDGVSFIRNDDKEKLWYVRGKTLTGENRGKIYRSNNQLEFDLSNQSTWQQPHGSRSNTCTQFNNNDNNNFGSGRNSKYYSGERNNNGYINHNTNANTMQNNNNNNNNNGNSGNYAPRNNMQQRFNRNNGRGIGLPNTAGAFDSPGGRDKPKTSAALYNYDLVGDDFFLALASIDLDCAVSKRRGINRSGLCISGQSIRDATDRIKRYPEQSNMKIIVNLGSVDILHGSDLSDVCQGFKELMRECQRRRIQPIITTLAPLANRLYCQEEVKKVRQFNEFLVNEFSGQFRVIDITSCLADKKTGKLMFCCYQPEPKYVTGSNQPHMLWNRIGRQRILKTIKANLSI